jgi:hypothetical protein
VEETTTTKANRFNNDEAEEIASEIITAESGKRGILVPIMPQKKISWADLTIYKVLRMMSWYRKEASHTYTND